MQKTLKNSIILNEPQTSKNAGIDLCASSAGGIKWRDIEALLLAMGAEVTEREGSRVGVKLFADRRVFHRPHPSPDTDKGAVESLRKWLEINGVHP